MVSATNLTTNPHEHVGFVSASPVRGTIQLVWDCLFTVILCTWNVQRPSVPSPKQPTWKQTIRKLCLALITIAAPELLAALALNQCLSARLNRLQMHRRGFRNWTMKHAFFADMGGYLLEYGPQKCMLVTSKEIEWLARRELLDPTELRSSDIDDLSREDVLQKIILTLQLGWFTLQCVGRAIEGLDFSLFEVTTLSFVTTALVILLLWWQKPIGVSARIRMQCPAVTDSIVEHMLAITGNDRRRLTTDLRIDNLHPYEYDIGTERMLGRIVLFFACCCAWHVAAWNYSFPTKVECVLWRLSSIIAVVAQVISILILAYQSAGKLGDWSTRVFYLSVAIYVVTRVYIIVETIASLRSAPAGIYRQVGWSTFVPHI